MTPRSRPSTKPASGKPQRVTAQQAFLRDAVRDPHWAWRGLLGVYVRRLAS